MFWINSLDVKKAAFAAFVLPKIGKWNYSDMKRGQASLAAIHGAGHCGERRFDLRERYQVKG